MSGRRHQAREAALQALYLWEIGGAEPDEALAVLFSEHQPDLDEAGRRFTTSLVHGTVAARDDLDRLIRDHSTHWRLERLATVDRLILRLGAWELRQPGDTPAPVVIDEAIELARTFGSDDSVRFVNGVLDSIRRTLEAAGG